MISPNFPPAACGVGDHGAMLARALVKAGHAVGVWTRAVDGPRDGEPGVEVQELALERTADAVERIAAWRPDRVLVQYTPYLYARYGVSPRLAGVLRAIRQRAGAPLAVIAHELHYPVEFSPRGILLGIPQRLQFRAIARAADHVFFTYEAARAEAVARLGVPAARASVLPVGATIIDRSPASAEAVDPYLVLHFGGNHPTHLLPETLGAFAALREGSPGAPLKLALVGLDPAALAAELGRLSLSLPPDSVQATGYVPSAEVSRWLARARLVLAPFMDGVSTRRSSVMTALAHGKPVLTTRGWATDGAVPWDAFCAIAEPAEFRARARALWADPARLAGLGQRARAEYEARFGWDRIASRLMEEWA